MKTYLLLLSSFSVVVSSAALAQSAGGPPIAYVKIAGRAHEIHLVQPDGSGRTKLYTSGSKHTIQSLDLRPGGGEIAFIERGSGSPVLKVLKFDDHGAAVGAPEVVTGPCNPDYVDYHPDPSQPVLILSDSCNQLPNISTVRTDGSDRRILQEADHYFGPVRWLNDGVSYVYVRAVDGVDGYQLCRNACDPAQGELLWTANSLSWMDVARNSNTILATENSKIHKVNGDAGGIMEPSPFISGTDGHFSPDDGSVLFETPHSARGDYLRIRNADGQYTTITGKGEYGAKDWRDH